jgi:hypothetical protein
MAQVARLTDPNTLLRPEVQDLFTRAFAGGDIIEGGFERAVEDIVRLITNPGNIVLVGAEDGQLRGLAILVMPSDKICDKPQIFHFYIDNSLPMRKAMIQKIVDTMLAAGYTKWWAINHTNRPDSVWARMFRSAVTSKRVGSIMEMTVK